MSDLQRIDPREWFVGGLRDQHSIHDGHAVRHSAVLDRGDFSIAFANAISDSTCGI